MRVRLFVRLSRSSELCSSVSSWPLESGRYAFGAMQIRVYLSSHSGREFVSALCKSLRLTTELAFAFAFAFAWPHKGTLCWGQLSVLYRSDRLLFGRPISNVNEKNGNNNCRCCHSQKSARERSYPPARMRRGAAGYRRVMNKAGGRDWPIEMDVAEQRSHLQGIFVRRQLAHCLKTDEQTNTTRLVCLFACFRPIKRHIVALDEHCGSIVVAVRRKEAQACGTCLSLPRAIPGAKQTDRLYLRRQSCALYNGSLVALLANQSERTFMRLDMEHCAANLPAAGGYRFLRTLTQAE